jgi:hypothetical protein
MSRRPEWLIATFWLMLLPWASAGASASSPPYLGERLLYTASYEGLLSAGKRMDIAEVVMSTQRRVTHFNGEPAYKTTVRASTDSYDTVDRLFPLRYEYNSLLSADLQRSLLFEQRKDDDGGRHQVVWFDWNERRVGKARRESGGDAAAQEAASPQALGADRPAARGLSALAELGIIDGKDAYETRSVEVPALPERLFDRLSMLQVLRLADLDRTSVLQIPVTDGERLLTYRVDVLGRERLTIDGESWDTYHLRLSAVEGDDAGASPDAPVDLWLGADRSRTPVRLASEHRLGRFEVRLKDAMRPLAEVAVGGSARLAGSRR